MRYKIRLITYPSLLHTDKTIYPFEIQVTFENHVSRLYIDVSLLRKSVDYEQMLHGKIYRLKVISYLKTVPVT
jgi:hypothetical protein